MAVHVIPGKPNIAGIRTMATGTIAAAAMAMGTATTMTGVTAEIVRTGILPAPSFRLTRRHRTNKNRARPLQCQSGVRHELQPAPAFFAPGIGQRPLLWLLIAVLMAGWSAVAWAGHAMSDSILAWAAAGVLTTVVGESARDRCGRQAGQPPMMTQSSKPSKGDPASILVLAMAFMRSWCPASGSGRDRLGAATR